MASSELLLLDDGCHCGRRACSSTATTATLVVLSAVLFAAAAVLAVATASPVADYVAVAAWGLSFGGAATLPQSALTRAAGKHADVAQSSMVTTWNLVVGLSGLVGGALLAGFGSGSLMIADLALLAPTALVASLARCHAFPRRHPVSG